MGKLPQEENQPIFVSGAVTIQNYQLEQGVIFSNEVWSGIYEQIRKYFMDLEVMGLVVTRNESEEGIPDRLKRIHLENFPGENRIFFLYDGEEKEENFYRTSKRQLVKQNGYYIYYEKNESMQNYMVDTLGTESEEKEYEDLAMEHVRNVIASKTEPVENKKMVHLMYAASTALAAVVLVIGTTMLNNYDKMNNMEQTLNHISDDVTELGKEDGNLLVETLNGNLEKASKKENFPEKEENEEDSKNDKKDFSNQKTDEKEHKKNKKIKTSEKKPASAKPVKYYTVKKGDTLVTISGKLYDSDEYVEAIQKMNGIEDKDVIYEGQKLLLP